jgi:endonuclease YncB( thermonuclease family)
MKLLAFLVAAMLAAPVAAETVSGRAAVVDGDTLQIEQARVRLFGIDAPELLQSCTRGGERWACGKASAERLQALIGDGAVSCTGDELDRYGRLVAVCTIGGTDLNAAMVSGGWATAFRRYSTRYVADEVRARAGKYGVWTSDFEAPSDFRREERAAASAPRVVRGGQVVSVAPAVGCLIKGNRNRRGEWIYHLPDTTYYGETRAEEMFCTEAAAQAAGYRKSRAP